jgi:autotransporter-associated beta strand protein
MKNRAELGRTGVFGFKSRLFPMVCLLILGLLSASRHAHAGSATWNLNPTSGDWNTAANWTPNTVPNGPADSATFDVSNTTDLTIGTDIELDEMLFQPGASSYSFALNGIHTFTFSGAGVMNNSAEAQAFLLNPSYHLNFTNGATVGSQTDIRGGTVSFYDTSSAGSGTFTVVQGAIQFYDDSRAGNGVFMVGGFEQPPRTSNLIGFNDNSSAENGYFILNGSTSSDLENEGFVYVDVDATAGNATFINMPSPFSGGIPGTTKILGSGGNGTFVANGSSVPGADAGDVLIFGKAGSASFTATGGTNGGEGGRLFFSRTGDGHSAQGQTCRCTVLGNGFLQLSTTDAPGLTIGSLEGDGLVYLTSAEFGSEKRLTVGTNNLDTTFAGVIQDAVASGGEPGFLAKVGTGTLTLSGPNTYTGGTIIRDGTLLAMTQNSSATGSGPVHLEAGTLGGTGGITGGVRIGTGSGAEAFLSPGVNGAGTLRLGSRLTFEADGVYNCEVDSTQVAADQVSAKKVTINAGALFSLIPLGTGTLPIGTVFTVIEARNPEPIHGTFSNLPDGAIVTVNGNNLQASYEGGDGNDFTLTVVP